MDIKLKSTKFKMNILYILVVVLISVVFLSILETKDNLRLIVPDRIYTETFVADHINDYTNLVTNYSMYYKSDKYTSDRGNITQSDINICKAELREKADQEYYEFRDFKWNDPSFNNLDYDAQDKLLSEKKKEIDERYDLSGDDLTNYVLERKSNSEMELKNKINSYINLKFEAFDKINNTWIGGDNQDITQIRSNSRYFKEINIDYNGNVIEKTYINGKEIDRNSAINKFIDSYTYNSYYGYGESTTSATYYNKYEYGNTYSDNHNITLYIWMPKNIQSGDMVYESFITIDKNVNKFYTNLFIMGVSIVLLVICLLILNKKKEKSEEIRKIIDKVKIMPIEYKVIAAIMTFVIWDATAYRLHYDNYISRLRVTSVIWFSLIILVWYIIIKVIIINYTEGTLFKNNISGTIYKNLSKMASKGSIFSSIFTVALIYMIIALILLGVSIMLPGTFFMCFVVGIIVTIALIVLVIKKLLYLDKIMIGAKDGARGQLNYKIDVKGNGHFGELANNINNIKEGLKKSVENEMKSENMKTELITNVSHDLKTPLTSIINYIDLLKRENIEPESAKDYVEVLDKKAQRLKVLIEDLFEASKAASGAMELNITKIDIAQLLKQALGENDERFNDNNLEVKLNILDEKIFINGDGKRLYRVFENLISNAAKYSLSNTRVYIDMYKNDDNQIVIIMKNISAYELNFDANEITNRFKRGDSSRSTDGSGLGLAIAKSIVELHGGKFTIEVDGDLFKSIIILK